MEEIMGNLRDKLTFIIHFREVPDGIKQLPIAFHLLAEFARRARRTEGEAVWNGEIIQLLPRQFITGRTKVSQTLGITEGKYRGAYKKLERLRYIKTIKVTKRYTVSEYLADSVFDINAEENLPSEQPSENTSDSPSNSHQITTNNNDNNGKNVNSLLESEHKESRESPSYKEKAGFVSGSDLLKKRRKELGL